MPNFTTFSVLEGVQFNYARPPVASYGSRGKPYTFRCTEALKSTLSRAVLDLTETCPLGRPEVITSAGAYVNKPGQHGHGRAVDIDGIFWGDFSFVTNEYSVNPRFYIGVESVFRKHFGLGLNYNYNSAHHDHLHLDLSMDVDFKQSSKSYTLYLQDALNRVYGKDIIVDGLWGGQTESATIDVLGKLGLSGQISSPNTWRAFLAKTAEAAFSESPTATTAVEYVESLSSVIEHLSIDGPEWRLLRGTFDTLLSSSAFQHILDDDTSEETLRLVMCQQIVNFEARRKANGDIKVYKLPGDDGGGRYEVAGINEKYHPEVCKKLKGIIEKDKDPERAENLAVNYIATYTDGASRWCSNSGVESYLRDSMWNRGPTGGVRILQMALGFKGAQVDGIMGPVSLGRLGKVEQRPIQMLADFRDAREEYERKVVGRDESSQFWKGLENRWRNAQTFAETLA